MNPVNVDELAAEDCETIYASKALALAKVRHECGCTSYRVHLDERPTPSEIAKVYSMIPDTHPLDVDGTDVMGGSVIQHFEQDGQPCPLTAHTP